MKITVEIGNAMVEKLWEQWQSRMTDELDLVKKSMMSIWSVEEVVAADAKTILEFYAAGKLIFNDSIFIMLDRGFIVGVYSTLAKAQEGYRVESVIWEKHVDWHWIARTSNGDMLEILQKTAQ